MAAYIELLVKLPHRGSIIVPELRGRALQNGDKVFVLSSMADILCMVYGSTFSRLAVHHIDKLSTVKKYLDHGILVKDEHANDEEKKLEDDQPEQLPRRNKSMSDKIRRRGKPA